MTGLVGPNGAGKSTLLNLAGGLIAPTTGTITVLGDRPASGSAQLARVGFVAQDTPVYARDVRRRSPARRGMAQPALGRRAGQALAGSGDRDAAGDEFRTYMMMLLVSAPVLTDATVSRNFLEQAQALGGEMVRILMVAPGKDGHPAGRIDDAVQRLRTASTPLLQVLDPETQRVVRGDQPG